MTTNKHCKHCGRAISPGRAGRRDYCSAACKQAAYRKRKNGDVTQQSVTVTTLSNDGNDGNCVTIAPLRSRT